MSDPMPTGVCWCGCEQSVSRGAFFVTGHDKRAESAVIKVEYGIIPTFLEKHGYGPGGKNPSEELRRFKEEGGEYL
jgi:hypothetical protein